MICFAFSNARAESITRMPESSFFAGPGPRIFAHRGLSEHRDDLTENTLESFLEALNYGATHLETDVQVTRDGQAVLFHDVDLSRVSSSKKKISELTFSELQQIKLNRGGSVPTLSQALAAFPLAKFNLDIKSEAAIISTVIAIEENAAHHRVLITSFSSSRRFRALHELSSPAVISPAPLTVLRVWISHYVLFDWGLGRLLREFDALQIPVRHGLLRFDGTSFIRKVSSFGVELHYWTINSPEQMRHLFERGAHGIVTDRVDLVPKEFLRED
jgi:glycerophosphoryl diester phosphodiesterase